MSKTKKHSHISRTTSTTAVPNQQPPPVSAASVGQLPDDLRKIQSLLDSNRLQEAFTLAAGRDHDGPIYANARAVCLMRMGKVDAAVKALRTAVLEGSGIFLRAAAPLACKINFAIALAMSGNVGGAVDILNEIRQEDDPRVQRLRMAIRRWECDLSFWEWVQWKGGISVSRPLSFDIAADSLIEPV